MLVFLVRSQLLENHCDFLICQVCYLLLSNAMLSVYASTFVCSWLHTEGYVHERRSMLHSSQLYYLRYYSLSSLEKDVSRAIC